MPTRVCIRRPPNGKLVDFRGFATTIHRHSTFLLDFRARERPDARLLSRLHASCAICTIKNHECLHYRHICFCSFGRQFSLIQCLAASVGSPGEERFCRRNAGLATAPTTVRTQSRLRAILARCLSLFCETCLRFNESNRRAKEWPRESVRSNREAPLEALWSGGGGPRRLAYKMLRRRPSRAAESTLGCPPDF